MHTCCNLGLAATSREIKLVVMDTEYKSDGTSFMYGGKKSERRCIDYNLSDFCKRPGPRRMSKHKDRRAMNFNDFVVLPNSAAKSVKLNARNLQQVKTQTGSLVQESEEMEEKLMKLKARMSQEKEERAQSGSSRWTSGQQGPLNKTTTLINPRRTKDSTLQKLSAGKLKIRVLQDEQAVQPPPPSPATAAPKPQRKSKLKGITCGQCEVRTAGVVCVIPRTLPVGRRSSLTAFMCPVHASCRLFSDLAAVSVRGCSFCLCVWHDALTLNRS
ncbi:hypothetical protein WMY93_029035 [Mugilogobius chulae]|uniref:Uncharacterized protein n=1 Tax=Mugilogobius chulae TaxID=88201 RepID=A0AAW0MUH9_9GOBI